MTQEVKRNSAGEVISRAAVMLPEVSNDAHFILNIEALEALEGLYEKGTVDGYVVHCFSELEKNTLSVVKAMAGLAVRSCTVDEVLAAMPVAEAGARLSDALSLTIYGRNVQDELEKRQAVAVAAMEKMKAARDAAEAKANA